MPFRHPHPAPTPLEAHDPQWLARRTAPRHDLEAQGRRARSRRDAKPKLDELRPSAEFRRDLAGHDRRQIEEPLPGDIVGVCRVDNFQRRELAEDRIQPCLDIGEVFRRHGLPDREHAKVRQRLEDEIARCSEGLRRESHQLRQGSSRQPCLTQIAATSISLKPSLSRNARSLGSTSVPRKEISS